MWKGVISLCNGWECDSIYFSGELSRLFYLFRSCSTTCSSNMSSNLAAKNLQKTSGLARATCRASWARKAIYKYWCARVFSLTLILTAAALFEKREKKVSWSLSDYYVGVSTQSNTRTTTCSSPTSSLQSRSDLEVISREYFWWDSESI